MDLFLPAGLRENLPQFGEEGAAWAAGLPEQLAELEREWSLNLGPALDHDGACSWIAPARLADGSEAILKVGVPHDEARFEAEALRFLDGRGAVRLLRASEDGFTLLLERCVPATDLWPLDVEEADAVAAGLLRRLWREPGPGSPFTSLAEVVARWCEELPREAPAAGYAPDLVAQATELGRELAASQPRRVLLHGDFHPSNVLAAQREPWLVIDPKPLVGDPAYDLAQWLANRFEGAMETPNPVAVLRQQVDRFSWWLDLDPDRIAGWAFVKSLGWEWGPETAEVFRQVAAR